MTESSSPLAAIHRPSMAHMFERNASLARFQRTNRFLAADVRGSSPAASLCADLSQNLGLDNEASPFFPTPRRALFGGALNRTAPVATPPGLESSPLPLREVESTPESPESPESPAEEGPSFFEEPVETEVEVVVRAPSPANVTSDEDEMMVDTPVPQPPRQPSVDSLKPLDRNRRFGIRRPALARVGKQSSFGASSGRCSTDGVVPQLRLNGESRVSFNYSNLSKGQCFEACSPPPAAAAALHLGSPAPSFIRRSTNPIIRTRRGGIRRTLSMFERAGDVMKPKQEPVAEPAASKSVVAAAEPERAQEPTLPHFFADNPTDTIPRITKATLLEVLDGKYSQSFDQKMVIDCRFEYEYDGGHIDGAVNYNDKELLARHLLETPMAGRTLLIFHCEYSAHRAPLMARHIRSQDRTANAERYPLLSYPDVYILDGGYSGFFDEYRGRCSPQEYIRMSDERHHRTCEREMGRLKARKNFGRAQTFAFGQRSRSFVLDSPPTPKPAARVRYEAVDMIGNSPILGERQHVNRRMASF